MSLDIVCLKVGEAYGPEYVNEMFKRVDDLMPVGDFICYTDNPLDLNSNITVRGITPLYNDRMWWNKVRLLYTSPSPRDRTRSRMPSSA